MSRYYYLWNNFITTPQRWMAYYLRRRGWVAFYLEPQSRECGTGTCWMRLYEEGEKAASRPPVGPTATPTEET